MAKSYFIAGTDTGVGKTLVAAALLHKASAQGLRTIGLKPIAAGGELSDSGVQNEDALELQRCASVGLDYEEVCPVTLPDPVSPHIAAERAGRSLNVDRIVGFCRGGLMRAHDLSFIEGAGGWRVPISPRALMSDIAKALNVPVILVVGMRLGCLNHALLTAESISHDGLPIAGWVSSVVDPEMACLDENITTLNKRFPFPCLGNIPFISKVSAESASEYVDISNLIESSKP